jgi:ligand-binding sensor domain-containing protein/DNA-binding CsgD family transcriptional regulator
MLKRSLFIIVSLLIFPTLQSQITPLPGTPYVKNFTEEDINFNLSVHGISQHENGILYFATPKGLLEFDGVRWNRYQHKSESDLRAVFFKDEKHIFTSGHGGFGYWSTDRIGKLNYTSLFFKQPQKDAPLLPIFSHINEVNGKILFQSFQQIISYDPDLKTTRTINAQRGFEKLLVSKNRAFVQDNSLGLFEIIDNTLQLIQGTANTKLKIVNIFVKKDGVLSIATKNNGFWTIKGNSLFKNKWPINDLMQRYITNEVEELDSEKYIVGTLRKGVFIIDSSGKTLLHQQKKNGLLENSIKAIFTDANRHVWLGMENGISFLQTGSNNSYLLDYDGTFGTVYTSFLQDNKLYVGTNQGLFYKDILDPDSEMKLIDTSVGQIWKIEKRNNTVLVGTEEGVYSLVNNKLRLIHKEGGAWIFKKHPKFEKLLYIGFYSGIGVFKFIDGQWVFHKKWDNYGESSRFIEFDKFGDLWVSHPSKGYYRLQLSDNGLDLTNYEFYGIDDPNVAAFAYLCKIDETLVFFNPKGFFIYDRLENSFTPHKYSTYLFKNTKDINSIVQDGNRFWYATPNSLGFIKRDRNRFENNKNSFYAIRNKHLKDFNKFEKLNDSIIAIGINNGVVFHSHPKDESKAEIMQPTIRSIQFISKKDSILSPISSTLRIEVPSGNNFLKIGLALPKTPLANSYKVQYKLTGLNEDWSAWDYASELNFPGLSPGKYQFEMRAGGENESPSEITRIEFEIQAPWYLTSFAFSAYIALLLSINLLYRTYFKKKTELQITTVKQDEADKRKTQEEQFHLDKLETEKEMLLLREENLNLELKKKNAAIASSTLNNIKKNELLIDLVKDIKKIDKELVNSALHYPIKKVIKKIDNHLVDKEDWLTFQLHFTNSHSQFFKNLREKHPDLSSNEIKLSAYLKLNLSSKEIASLMNIAITSVEQSRYRLRKKFKLEKDMNLTNYIQKV